MGKSTLVQFLLSNPNGKFKYEVEKGKTESKNSIKRLILQSISVETKRLIEERYHDLLVQRAEELSREEKSKIHDRASLEVHKELRKTNAASKNAGREAMKKAVSPVFSDDVTSMDAEQKYMYAATIFFRLVARTPYDESYMMSRQAPDRARKGFTYGTDPETGKRVIKSTTRYFQHEPDDDVVREDWNIEINNVDGSSIVMNMKDFGGVSFENVTGAGWKSVESVMKKANGGKEIKNINTFNMNPRCTQLEFGRYLTSNTEEVHKGSHRFHGVHNGYSVQAPRGFVRVTQMESSHVGRLSQESVSPKFYKDMKGLDIAFSAFVPDNSSKLVEEFVKENKDEMFNEKDILKALLAKNRKLPVRMTAEEYQKKMDAKVAQKIKREDDKWFAKLKQQMSSEMLSFLKEEEDMEYEERENDEAERLYKESKKQKKRDGLKSSVEIPGLRDEKQVIEDAIAKIDRKTKKQVKQKKEPYRFGVITVKGKAYACAVKGTLEKGNVLLKDNGGHRDEDFTGYRPYELVIRNEKDRNDLLYKIFRQKGE